MSSQNNNSLETNIKIGRKRFCHEYRSIPYNALEDPSLEEYFMRPKVQKHYVKNGWQGSFATCSVCKKCSEGPIKICTRCQRFFHVCCLPSLPITNTNLSILIIYCTSKAVDVSIVKQMLLDDGHFSRVDMIDALSLKPRAPDLLKPYDAVLVLAVSKENTNSPSLTGGWPEPDALGDLLADFVMRPKVDEEDLDESSGSTLPQSLSQQQKHTQAHRGGVVLGPLTHWETIGGRWRKHKIAPMLPGRQKHPPHLVLGKIDKEGHAVMEGVKKFAGGDHSYHVSGAVSEAGANEIARFMQKTGMQAPKVIKKVYGNDELSPKTKRTVPQHVVPSNAQQSATDQSMHHQLRVRMQRDKAIAELHVLKEKYRKMFREQIAFSENKKKEAHSKLSEVIQGSRQPSATKSVRTVKSSQTIKQASVNEPLDEPAHLPDIVETNGANSTSNQSQSSQSFTLPEIKNSQNVERAIDREQQNDIDLIVSKDTQDISMSISIDETKEQVSITLEDTIAKADPGDTDASVAAVQPAAPKPKRPKRGENEEKRKELIQRQQRQQKVETKPLPSPAKTPASKPTSKKTTNPVLKPKAKKPTTSSGLPGYIPTPDKAPAISVTKQRTAKHTSSNSSLKPDTARTIDYIPTLSGVTTADDHSITNEIKPLEGDRLEHTEQDTSQESQKSIEISPEPEHKVAVPVDSNVKPQSSLSSGTLSRQNSKPDKLADAVLEAALTEINAEIRASVADAQATTEKAVASTEPMTTIGETL
eukprot:jgi/Hompol1/1324/HPOL_005560-RA